MQNLTPFSVLCCIYFKDDIKAFEDAVHSVCIQSLLPSEFVLIVDGPLPKKMSDEVDRILSLLSTIDISVTRNDLIVNSGHGVARRVGVEKCSNEIIAIIDADDINLPHRFKVSIDLMMQMPDVDVVGGDIEEFSASTLKTLSAKRMQFGYVSKGYIGLRCPINQMTVVAKRSAILAVGNYQDFYNNEDYHLWIRLYNFGYKIFNLGEIVVRARVNDNFYSRRGGIKYFKSESRIQIMLFSSKIIGFPQLCLNVIIRFVVQVVLPNSLRRAVYNYILRVQ